MTEHAPGTGSTVATTGVIDAHVRHTWSSPAELVEYLPRAWREYLGRPDSLPAGGGMMNPFPTESYRNPRGEKAHWAYPADGRPPGSDRETLRRHVLDDGPVARAVLSFDVGALMPAHANHYLGLELTRAANAWTLERWLGGEDDRFYGLLLAANHLPEEAAADIRRHGSHSRVVGVLLGGNGIGKPFGHPLYHGLYAAAAEMGLPLVLTAGGDASPDTLTHPSGGGLPSTYAEYRVLAAQAIMTHLVSMVAQGVFELYPGLRVLVTGAGASWLPGLIWRYDTEYKTLRREVPWMTDLPSRYFTRHVRVCTYPLHIDGEGGKVARLLGSLAGVEDLLCYGSGYPSWDCESPAEVAKGLPTEWAARVFFENADGFFRWAPTSLQPLPREAGVGQMVAGEGGRSGA
jgi:uncharacterized protein